MAFMQQLNRRRAVPLAVFGLLALVSLACVASARREVEGFNLRRNYTLPSGQQLTGDQVVLAYGIILEPGSTIAGDATLTGQRITLNGTVTGDAVVVGDRLTVGDQAHVTGDLVACVKTLKRSDSAMIDGAFKEECRNSGSVSARNIVESGWNSWRGSVFFRISAALIGSLAFGALAALISTVLPRPLVRMSESVNRAPVQALGVGFLTFLVLIGVTIAYVISLLLVLPVILMPFMIVIWLVVGLLCLLGWVALAVPLGVFVLARLGLDRQPRMIAAAVGGITLALLLRVWSIFWFTAWIGLLMTVVFGSLGLGAVILTRVGMRSYPPGRSSRI